MIDSEVLAGINAAKFYATVGYHMTAEQFIARFAGQSFAHNVEIIEAELGHSIMHLLPRAEMKRDLYDLFRAELQPIAGIEQALDSINLPMCIASGSEPDRLELTLRLTGLYERFAGNIYSSTQVQHGKPAPDLFLYAAEQQGFAPDECLVIEDSVNGVRAAQAAGMPVWGFVGGSHITPTWREKLVNLGVQTLFDDMRKLPAMLRVAM